MLDNKFVFAALRSNDSGFRPAQFPKHPPMSSDQTGNAPPFSPDGPLPLYWLPIIENWDALAREIFDLDEPSAWARAVHLANARLDFVKTIRLDQILRKRFRQPPADLPTHPVRLALLGSGTLNHLLPGLRVGALRRGIWLDAYVAAYEQYFQELLDPVSPLHRIQPNTVLFSFDAVHLFGHDLPSDFADSGPVETATAKIAGLWQLARQHFDCPIIQQTVMPLAVPLMGSNEHRMPGSPRRLALLLNERLRTMAGEHSVDILGIDDRLLNDGLHAWHDAALWHRAKQEISPSASHFYGDLATRLIGARQGRSVKCLVLDLDNTLWGGIIGDDGLEGIRLGQGSALGEAFVAFQRYAQALSRRGIILAVCSKNDEPIARAPFERHPEMILKLPDIAAFVANWQDKATNLREIAHRLSLSLEHLVFVDDNPAERDLIRRQLPAVAVPELPEDPALYPQCLADAGYFEALYLTADDSQRTRQYQQNRERDSLKTSAASMEDYLRSLEMELQWYPFDEIGLQRIVQLINKTNQFNLTTRRYTESEVRGFMDQPAAITLQLRLADRFGDNGMISAIITPPDGAGGAFIDTWLMSCRVLGRGVEEAALNLLAEQARSRGLEYLTGEYLPTDKNGMVAELYPRLGFHTVAHSGSGSRWQLDLANFTPRPTFIATKKMSC